MANPFGAGLPEFKSAGLKEFFQATGKGRDAKITLKEDRALRRKSKHAILHALHIANAAKQLGELPAKGWTVHAIMRGNFNGWDLVPAVLRLAEPHTIKRLYVATLGFNERNLEELVRMLDEKKVAAVRFICSVFFRSHTPELWTNLQNALSSRGHDAVAIRSHAKILLMETTAGHWLVCESSANLRTCHNIEQLALSNDRPLWQFHADWMDSVIADAKANPVK